MSDLVWEFVVVLLPYLVVFSLFFLVPYFLGLGLWKLGLKGKTTEFKEFYKALQLILCSSVLIFFIFRILLWSWKW